jgi:cell division protein FtsW
MASFLSRTDRSRAGRWWWTVDYWALGAIAVLIVAGALMSLAASPAVAHRIGLDPFHFVYKQLMFILPAAAIMVGISLLEPKEILKAGVALFAFAWVCMVLTLFLGEETKGATRWLQLGPIGFQPSEFAKPAFVIVAAWALTANPRGLGLGGFALASTLFAMTVGVLILQPDFGQTMLVTVAFAALLFFWGVPWSVIGVLGAGLASGAYAAYHLMPHVASRVDRFLDPKAGDSYQVETALAAIAQGGPGGVGPGEGVLKYTIPDAHADFIFAVAGEEFGLIAGIVLIGAFAVILFRGLSRAMDERNPFVQLAAGGLLVIFTTQAVINMAVNLNLMPAKGMTLPFVSYGGSSMLALAVTAGMILSLTRKRPGSGIRRA